jgi:hypothetical protein
MEGAKYCSAAFAAQADRRGPLLLLLSLLSEVPASSSCKERTPAPRKAARTEFRASSLRSVLKLQGRVSHRNSETAAMRAVWEIEPTVQLTAVPLVLLLLLLLLLMLLSSLLLLLSVLCIDDSGVGCSTEPTLGLTSSSSCALRSTVSAYTALPLPEV